MALRFCLLAAVWLSGWGLCDVAEAQSAGSGEPTPAATAPTEPAMTVDEAVRSASEALDRLESSDPDEPRRPVLEHVFDKIEFVQNTDPNHPMLSFLLGRTYALAGREKDAVQQLQAFIETREGKNEWRGFRLLGDLLVGPYPQLAQAHYRTAGTLKPNEPTVLFGLAQCFAKRGRTAEAIRAAAEAVEADGRKTLQYVAFHAAMLAAAKQWNEAEAEALAALELARQAMQAKPGRRMPVEVVEVQYKVLIGVLRARVLEVEDDVDAHLRLAGHLRGRAEILVLLSDHDALAVIERVRGHVAAPSPRLLEQYGIALAQVGRRDEAVRAFEDLLALSPGHETAVQWLARLRGTSGDETSEQP